MDQIEQQRSAPGGRLKRLEHALGPVLSGLVLDMLDLATFGPIGLVSGLVIGGAAGWYLAGSHGVAAGQRWLWALAAGAYCTTPFTEFFPCATLLGAVVRYRQAGGREQP